MKFAAPVLQGDAGAGHDHARAEACVVGLDKADHHAVAVGGAQVDGAARIGVAGSGLQGLCRRSGRAALAA